MEDDCPRCRSETQLIDYGVNHLSDSRGRALPRYIRRCLCCLLDLPARQWEFKQRFVNQTLVASSGEFVPETHVGNQTPVLEQLSIF